MGGSSQRSLLFVVAVLAVSFASRSEAQPAAFTGYELALSGSSTVRAARPARFHGVAYRVRGLAELVPFEGRVRARFAKGEDDVQSAWVTVRSAADGRFEVEVPIPPMDDHPGPSRVELSLGPDDDERTFAIDVSPVAAVSMMLRSDRRLYEPGEPAHVWLLLTDGESGRPVAGHDVKLTIEGGPLPRSVRTLPTAPSGVAHVELAIPDGAPHGPVTVTAEVEGQMTQQASFQVGTRTWERLLATLEITDDEVAPQASTTALVHVTTPSGSPVSGARVTVHVGQTEYPGETDDEGNARVRVVAPAYHTSDSSLIGVRADVVHPAHGSVAVSDTMRLSVPATLSVEAYARNGGLVPEIDDVLYVRLRNGADEPPPVGTELTIEGPAVRMGSRTFTTDVHGFAEIPLRLPLGSASAASGTPQTPLLVRVLGPHEHVAHVSIPVFREAELGIVLDKVVAEPGSPVTVRVLRRPGAARAAVTVELVGPIGEPLAVTRIAPGRDSARIDLPPDRLGLFSVVARTLREDESFEGPASFAALVVRPANPDFVSLSPERRRWVVGETARVQLTTAPGSGRSYGAVLVRDLSAHGGEVPFQRSYLEGQFDEAILDPSTPSADRLLRAALAAHCGADDEPPRAAPLTDALGLAAEPEYSESAGPLRDPFPMSRELSRRGVAEAMQQIEARLAEALAAGALDDVTTVTAGRRRFVDDLLAGAGYETLGGGEITPAILSAADPAFTYDAVAHRIARARLVRILVALAAYLDPGDDASPAAQMASREPPERWLPRMVERGLLSSEDVDDPWGGHFQLRRTASPSLVVSARAANLELVSPGPDGRAGTRDDVRDPFARAVVAGTPYALASGEDELMRRLAVLSPLSATLTLISEAYRRTSAEMREEEIGDAVSAEVSEESFGLGGLGTIGHGAGGGGGSGYGRGAGGFGRRTARTPSVRMGHAQVSNLAGIVRERFPPTLLFVPDLALDDSGTTQITIPLADTVTTYLVEVIVWRDDGWVWSADTRIEVDRDIVVDAPIPTTAHRGDVVRLPLRISNRGERSRELVLRLVGDETLGVPDSEPHRLTLAGGDARVVPVEVELGRVGEGQLTVVATTPDGEAVDAVRRPIQVIELARRVIVEGDVVGEGEAVVTVDVPRGADPRGASLFVAAGPTVFGAIDPASPWAAWSAPSAEGADALRELHTSHSPVHRAFWLGSVWNDGVTSDEEVVSQAVQLTSDVDNVDQRLENMDDAAKRRLHAVAWTLLGLAPIADAPRRRSAVEPAQLVDRLRTQVAEQAMGAVADPEGWVLAAAALGFGAGHSGHATISELLRRARRHAVVIGEDRWLATDQRAVRSTLLWALAELSLGHRQSALSLLSTVGRWTALDNSLASDELGIAVVVMSRLLDGEAPASVEVTIDGARRVVDLVAGSATVDAPELARPGSHRIVARTVEGALVHVATSSRYGIGWRHAPAERGPLTLAIEGDAGAVDEVAELELVVRNRSPRTLPQPVVELELPTGAELTARARREMLGGARSAEVSEGVLRLSLSPMPPGREYRIPLPLRWSVEGRLRGLGAAAWAQDRPAGVTVLRPRTIGLGGGGR